MGFPRQESWSRLPFPSPGDLIHPGMEPRSPALQADSLPSEPSGKPLQALWLLVDSASESGGGGGGGVAKSCASLCDAMDWSPLGSSVHGISQARILEWVAISYSWGSSPPRDRTCISCISRQILYY